MQVKTLRAEIVSLQEDLSSLRAKEEDFAQEKLQLESALKLALCKIYPEKTTAMESTDEKILEEYLQKL